MYPFTHRGSYGAFNQRLIKLVLIFFLVISIVRLPKQLDRLVALVVEKILNTYKEA